MGLQVIGYTDQNEVEVLCIRCARGRWGTFTVKHDMEGTYNIKSATSGTLDGAIFATDEQLEPLYCMGTRRGKPCGVLIGPATIWLEDGGSINEW